jgi:hypothetical protein
MVSARQLTVVVMQPYFLPYRSYYGLIRKADVFVVFDDVQFCRGWQQRNQILAPEGKKRWITIPVWSSRPARQRIDETRICQEGPWAETLLFTVWSAYGEHPWFDDVYPELRELMIRPCERLVDLTVPLLRWSALKAGIPLPTWLRSSELGGRLLPPSERLLQICQHLGATTYLSGPAARSYLDIDLFRRHGIEVTWHEEVYFPYPQRGSGPFDHFVSILDLLMNCGPSSQRYL